MNRWDFVAAGAERAAFFAGSTAFEERLVRLTKGYRDEIRAALHDDDVPLFVLPVQLRHEGKKPPAMALLLQDRAVLLWSTGLVRMKEHTAEIPYSDVTSISLEGDDGLEVNAMVSWHLGGFRDTTPIFRDLIAATLRNDFECRLDEHGHVTNLEFHELGMRLSFTDDND